MENREARPCRYCNYMVEDGGLCTYCGNVAAPRRRVPVDPKLFSVVNGRWYGPSKAELEAMGYERI